MSRRIVCRRSSQTKRAVMGAVAGGIVGGFVGYMTSKAFPLLHAPGLRPEHDPWVLGIFGAGTGAYIGARAPQC